MILIIIMILILITIYIKCMIVAYLGRVGWWIQGRLRGRWCWRLRGRRPPASAAAAPSLPSSSLEPERQQHKHTALTELVAFLNRCLDYKVLKTIEDKSTLELAIEQARESHEYRKELDNDFYDNITWEEFQHYKGKLHTRQSESGGRKRKKSRKFKKTRKYKKSKKHHKKKSRNKRR